MMLGFYALGVLTLGQTDEVAYGTAFQPDAFQEDAFQIAAEGSLTAGATASPFLSLLGVG